MKRITLTQFLVSRQKESKLINADLRLLIETIARACKAISTRVNKGALADGLGSAEVLPAFVRTRGVAVLAVVFALVLLTVAFLLSPALPVRFTVTMHAPR